MMNELVKRLRNCVDSLCGECRYQQLQKPGNFVPCMNAMITEAAEAIEELSAIREEQKAQIIAMAAEDKPRWIPVTERLPEQKINQNTLDFEYVLCATTFGDVRPYKFGRRIGQGEPHFWNGAGYVDTYVTHWMPLPEPPKEE